MEGAELKFIIVINNNLYEYAGNTLERPVIKNKNNNYNKINTYLL